MKINRRYRVELGPLADLEVVLVGCGGTGSFVALHLARLAYHLRARTGQTLAITFVDPDTVEEQNVGRQNFCPAEIGQSKSWTLMRRYNAAFGLAMRAIVAPFAREMLPGGKPVLLVGCVDNAAARRELDTATRQRTRVWWLDAGNHEFSGQVLLGNRDIAHPEISPLGFCAALPLPSVVHPELVQDTAIHPMDESVESCAELAARDAQSLMINQMMAGWVAAYLARLLVSKDLDMRATYVDLLTGSARSVEVTDEH